MESLFNKIAGNKASRLLLFFVPVDTQSCFNVYKTSIKRRLDVLWTLKWRYVSTGVGSKHPEGSKLVKKPNRLIWQRNLKPWPHCRIFLSCRIILSSLVWSQSFMSVIRPKIRKLIKGPIKRFYPFIVLCPKSDQTQNLTKSATRCLTCVYHFMDTKLYRVNQFLEAAVPRCSSK